MKTASLFCNKFCNIVFFIVVIVSLLSSCSEKSTPERTIQQFQAALNVSDYEGVLDCFEPKVKNGIMGMATIAGNFLGLDGTALLDMLPFVLDIAAANNEYLSEDVEELENVLESIDITVNSVQYNDQQTKASVSVTINIFDYSQDDTINMVKVKDIWYISS